MLDVAKNQGSGVSTQGANEIANALNAVVADLFALYAKTKNFHRHMTGAHFRDYNLLLDEQGLQVLATIDPAAERIRKLGRSTLRSVGRIARLQRVADNESGNVTPKEMLTELATTTAGWPARCATHTNSATATTTSPLQA